MKQPMESSGIAEPLVTVCVLNWKSEDHTIACVRSVLDQSYPHLKVVVVDNGSTQDSESSLRGSGLDFELLCMRRNLGFTGGVNTAIRHAMEGGADFVWLLNSDAVVEAETLSTLMAAALREPGTGIWSPLICSEGGDAEIENCGTQVNIQTGEIEAFDRLDQAQRCLETAPEQFCVWGTAMLVSRKTFEQIGALDEQFFAYYEDTDYCVRAQQAGIGVSLVSAARVIHGPTRQSVQYSPPPHRAYYLARNLILFWRKHAPRGSRWKFVYWTIKTLLRNRNTGKFTGEARLAVLDGIWCGLQKKTGEWKAGDRRLQAPRLVRWMDQRASAGNGKS